MLIAPNSSFLPASCKYSVVAGPLYNQKMKTLLHPMNENGFASRPGEHCPRTLISSGFALDVNAMCRDDVMDITGLAQPCNDGPQCRHLRFPHVFELVTLEQDKHHRWK